MRQFAEELWRGERRRRSSRAHYAASVRTYVCLSGLRRRTLSKWARADIMRPRDLQPRRVAICTPCKRPRYVTQERDNNGKLPPRCKYVPLHKSDESSVLFSPFLCRVCVLSFLSVHLSNDMSRLGISGSGFDFHVSTKRKGEREKKKEKKCAHSSCESELTASFPPAQNGFAVVRPPGHHADPSNAM